MKSRKPFEPEIEKKSEFEPRLPRRALLEGHGVLGQIRAVKKHSRSFGGKSRASRVKSGKGRMRPKKVFNQRAIVKARVVKGGGKKSVQRLRSHLSYLHRSGTGSINAERPEFFDKEKVLSKEELSKRAPEWANDPHHFRFIVSPERGSDLS